MSDALVRLDYSPSAGRRRTRTIRKSAALAIVLLLLGLGALWWGRPVWNQYRLLVWQHRAMTFVDPPGKVVYEEDPSASAKLLAGGGYERIPYAGTFAGTDWNPVMRVTPDGQRVIFLHGLIDPAGRKYLVCFAYHNLNAEEFGNGRIARLTWDLEKPAGLLPGCGGRSRLFNLSQSQYDLAQGLNSGDRVRIFGGQPDPTDPSRFTIPYEINDVPGVIEGQLNANDYIDLKQK